jgi:hypothetical protein
MSEFWARAFGIVNVTTLVPHEQIIEDHLQELLETIWRDGVLRQPVIVDRASMVILDGHHRVSAMKKLSCPLIPAYLVDYSDPGIVVHPRRADIPVDKESVVRTGLGGVPYPPLTSRHEWPCSPDCCPVALADLVDLMALTDLASLTDSTSPVDHPKQTTQANSTALRISRDPRSTGSLEDNTRSRAASR